MTAPIRLYRHPLSGHAHRAQLMLSLLDLPHTLVDVDLAAGAHKQPEYLAKNPMGQVPVIEDDGFTLADSNAILVYLASRYDPEGRWYPDPPRLRGEIQRWLSLAAGELKAGPADARLVTVFGAPLDHERALATGHRVLAVVEDRLADHRALVGAGFTVADVALYSYIAHAPEGGISLDGYPHIRRWLAAIERLPGFVPMRRTAAGLVAEAAS